MDKIIEKVLEKLTPNFKGITAVQDEVDLPHSRIYKFKWLNQEKAIGIPFAALDKPKKEDIENIVEEISNVFNGEN